MSKQTFKRPLKYQKPQADWIQDRIRQKGGTRLSIYFSPEPSPPESEQNPITFRQLLDSAHKQLLAADMEDAAASDFLQPLRDALDHPDFFLKFPHGAGFFLDPMGATAFSLPYQVETRVAVASRYLVKPLLPLLSENPPFSLLCLNRDDIRMLRGNALELDPVNIPGLPANLAEVVWPDDPEKSPRARAAATRSASGKAGSEQAAAFHGHGLPSDLESDQQQRLFKAVAKAVAADLAKRDDALVVMGVEDNIGWIRREMPDLRQPVFEIMEDPSARDRETLHQKAREALLPRVEQRRNGLLERLNEARAKDEGIFDLPEAGIAAGLGRLAVCAVAGDRGPLGHVDPEHAQVSLAESGEDAPCVYDLLDYIAAETIAHGGDALVLPSGALPNDLLVGAIPRY